MPVLAAACNITINLPAPCYRLHTVTFFITRFRFTRTNITAYRKSFFMPTFITKLSFNLTVLKNPPCNIIVTYNLHPCHFPTSTTARIQRTIICSHQKTWPVEKQSTTCAICWLKSVQLEEKRRTGSDGGAGVQTQQKTCRTSPVIGAEEENHIGRGPI